MGLVKGSPGRAWVCEAAHGVAAEKDGDKRVGARAWVCEAAHGVTAEKDGEKGSRGEGVGVRSRARSDGRKGRGKRDVGARAWVVGCGTGRNCFAGIAI
jgi:hypothetical protein